MMRSLIAIAALAATPAFAEIKREDYPSYQAYLNALSAYNAEQMARELDSERASESKEKEAAGASEEARDDNQNRRAKKVSFAEEDKKAKTLTIWHNLEPRATCTLIINGETVGAKELRDGEKWVYKYEIEGAFTYSAPCQTEGGIVATKDERNRVVLRNVSSKPRVCRMEMDERPTQDYVIAPDMARAIKTSGNYRWHCHAGTEYRGYIEKREG